MFKVHNKVTRTTSFWYLIFGSRPLGKKESYYFTNVSMSVGKCFFSKMAHRIFSETSHGIRVPSGWKTDGARFFGKNFIWMIMLKNTPKKGFFGFCHKNSPLMCRFFGFKSCTIILLLANQIAGFLNFNISKTIGGIKLIFYMQTHIYQSCKLMM